MSIGNYLCSKIWLPREQFQDIIMPDCFASDYLYFNMFLQSGPFGRPALCIEREFQNKERLILRGHSTTDQFCDCLDAFFSKITTHW